MNEGSTKTFIDSNMSPDYTDLSLQFTDSFKQRIGEFIAADPQNALNAEINRSVDETFNNAMALEQSELLEDYSQTDGSVIGSTPISFVEDTSTKYQPRTMKNAAADATIAIAVDFESAGEKLTKSSVESQGKVYIPIDIKTNFEITGDIVNEIVNSLNNIGKDNITLNMAGNGIYTMKGKYTQAQLDEYVYQLLSAVINSENLKNKIISIRSGGQTGIDEAGAKAGMRLGIPTTILAPKGWTFRPINGKDKSSESEFKARFNVTTVSTPVVTDAIDEISQPTNDYNNTTEYPDDAMKTCKGK